MSQNPAAQDHVPDFLEEVVTAAGNDRTKELAEKVAVLEAQLSRTRQAPRDRHAVMELRVAAQEMRNICGAFVSSPAQQAARAAERLGTRLLLGTRVALEEWLRVGEQLAEVRELLATRIENERRSF
jgi:hypothetical protein